MFAVLQVPTPQGFRSLRYYIYPAVYLRYMYLKCLRCVMYIVPVLPQGSKEHSCIACFRCSKRLMLCELCFRDIHVLPGFFVSLEPCPVRDMCAYNHVWYHIRDVRSQLSPARPLLITVGISMIVWATHFRGPDYRGPDYRGPPHLLSPPPVLQSGHQCR